jgi:hypothetical protein
MIELYTGERINYSKSANNRAFTKKTVQSIAGIIAA